MNCECSQLHAGQRAQRAQGYLLSWAAPERQPQLNPEIFREKNKNHRVLNSPAGSGGEQDRSKKRGNRKANNKTLQQHLSGGCAYLSGEGTQTLGGTSASEMLKDQGGLLWPGLQVSSG